LEALGVEDGENIAEVIVRGRAMQGCSTLSTL
jgi:hypothetical protein